MKKVENIVAEGEIACFEQFHPLSECFQKASSAEASLCVKGLNVDVQCMHFKQQYLLWGMIH